MTEPRSSINHRPSYMYTIRQGSKPSYDRETLRPNVLFTLAKKGITRIIVVLAGHASLCTWNAMPSVMLLADINQHKNDSVLWPWHESLQNHAANQ